MREYEEPIDTNQVVEYWIKLPYKLNFIKKDIFFFLQKDLEVDWKVNDYFLQSIVRKDNDIGIYTYTYPGAHRVYKRIFMYDGTKNVINSNINDSIGMQKFLNKNNFSKEEMNEYIKNFNRIKAFNEDVYRNYSW